ncbi:hypothetical protein LAZ67_2002246 [Cordylochernes scorpioides]|uniref:HECT-type E3 ubiquitin transferase n=1 Tax=Cordylochernes scorpioides TaxID=51811 RepID=A0ABY6K218_9ARAC|nr:hypothetical protein LAZ67_2002246 [Cordylochernes scorpioides]
MAQIQPPETFDFSTPNEWPKWRKRFERYLVVSGMKKKEEADKIDLFMYLMGDRADDIFRTFKFEKEEEATKIDSVLKAFDSHFCVRKNIIYERAKFNSRIQEDREPVDEFITSLYKLADSCEFEGLHEQLIRDRIVVGVRDKALSERMQLDSELTLEKAVKMVRQQEAVRQQQVDLQRPSTSQKVNQVKFNSKKQSPKQQQQPSRKKEKSAKTRSRCPKCGGFTHREGQACRAEGQRCNLCSKTGHFANCCPDKQAKTAEVKAVSELDEEIGFLLEVSAVEDSSNLDNDEDECRRRWTAEIQVNGKQVKFKLDSQADVTCVPLCLFKKIMGQQRLVESDINLRAAEFSEIQTVGMFISTLRNGNYEIKEKIYVIRRLSEPLLSRRACELLNLARRIEVVATRINPIKEFPEVFEGLGQIGNPYEIKLKPGAKPYAVHTPRRVPIPLMEKLKTRLEELEKAGIIAQVNVATEWCAPTVIAGKPNGDIRLCVDLSRLNEHVQREVHPMPVVEHMLGQLGEARFFSKLDANSGFHQIPLSPDCQHLTTFITPFGRYKYCRMPFGISLAPEYFQRVMSIILQGMDGVMCYLDDILIFASDSKTHDRILRLVLRKLKEAKVTLNKAKCVFGVPRINFLGHILDEDGIRPDPAKIEAVAKMPAPTDVHGVRRFLGMVNHLGRFVENLSEIVAPLNQLLVKGQDFVWDCSQERAFRKLKELLTTQPILAAYDVRKPTMVSSDASSYGLGAVLKQEEPNPKLMIMVKLINTMGLDEPGIDGGGIFREFLGELLKTAFDPTRGFFVATTDQLLYPNPAVHLLMPDFPKHYYFIGRMLGKAMYENMLLELPLADFFLAKLLNARGSNVDVHHLASLDPMIYKNLLSLKTYEGDVADLGLDFTAISSGLGESKLVELKPGGANIPVTEDNRIEYIHLMADYKLNRQIRAQTQAFKEGMASVIDLSWLRMLNYSELQTLISGAHVPVDVEDLRAHAVYNGGYTAEHPTILAFWSTVESFSETQLRQLLRFVTSCSRPPLLGFRELHPNFCIQRAGDVDRLPTASTCMNLLKLPEFQDQQTLREKLLYAIESGAGFELS